MTYIHKPDSEAKPEELSEMSYEIGDKVIFKHIIRNKAEDWQMSERQFEQVKSYLGKIGTVKEIEKRYNDNSTVSYFLTVRFSSGFRLDRVNRFAFLPFETDFDYI